MNEDGRVERLFRFKTRKGSINHQPNCKSSSIQMSPPLCHFRFLSFFHSFFFPQPLLHSCSKCISFQSIHLIVRFFLRKKRVFVSRTTNPPKWGFLAGRTLSDRMMLWISWVEEDEASWGKKEKKGEEEARGRRRRKGKLRFHLMAEKILRSRENEMERELWSINWGKRGKYFSSYNLRRRRQMVTSFSPSHPLLAETLTILPF